ncbi:MAG TPA: hypothetical protein VGE29_13525 [Prosthecobacter sp.]
MLHLLLLAAVLFLLPFQSSFGQRLGLSPLDFQPLVSLPWKHHEDVSLEKVLERIFLESNPAIRHAVLSSYLHRIPVEDFPRAFDLCITLQGTQWPDELVALILPIWAERDPQAAWKHSQTLFSFVAFDWLSLDKWSNPKIEVSDLDALRKSPFWLTRGLETFPQGIKKSRLARADKIVILSDFASRYLATFGSLPEVRSYESPVYTSSDTEELIRAFEAPYQGSKEEAIEAVSRGYKGTLEVILRRWLARAPKEAADIIAFSQTAEWPDGKTDPDGNTISQEWLLQWAKTDLPGMASWVEPLDPRLNTLSTRARALLLGFADAATRQRLLEQAKANSSVTDDVLAELIHEAAPWNPQLAIDFAVSTANAEAVLTIVENAVYGFQSRSWNTCHFGLGIVNDFDIRGLPRFLLTLTSQSWGITIMEQWGDIDVAEAARYGFRFLSEAGICPRENLIKLFSGDDQYSSDSDMIDRTFCALRTWAVLQPDAMKAWIAQQESADMREALTWLLDHPRGTGSSDR